MSKEVISVIIRSNGKIIGEITVDQFRNACGFSNRQFLREQIELFNANKKSIGDPERAEIN